MWHISYLLCICSQLQCFSLGLVPTVACSCVCPQTGFPLAGGKVTVQINNLGRGKKFLALLVLLVVDHWFEILQMKKRQETIKKHDNRPRQNVESPAPPPPEKNTLQQGPLVCSN